MERGVFNTSRHILHQDVASISDREEIAEGRVVPHDVDNVWRPTVLLPQFSKPGIQRLVFGGPSLTILCFENVILGVMDDCFLLRLSTTWANDRDSEYKQEAS